MHIGAFSDNTICRDVDGRDDGVFFIRHKLLLSVEPRPGLENVRALLGLHSQDCPHIRPYTVVEALHTRLREAIGFVENECCPGSRNVAVVSD